MTEQIYAFENPISLLVDRPREELTREDLVRMIALKRIERITSYYTALDGKLKELMLPVANRRQAEEILAGGERVDGSSLSTGLAPDGRLRAARRGACTQAT